MIIKNYRLLCTFLLNIMDINMFHIHAGYLYNSLYELEAINTGIIAEQNQEVLKIEFGFYATLE